MAKFLTYTKKRQTENAKREKIIRSRAYFCLLSFAENVLPNLSFNVEEPCN